jgi:uncharacterized protein YbbK (DUF523 family)
MTPEALVTRYRLLHGETEAARAELRRLRASGEEVVLVSACAAGVRCRPDGSALTRALPATGALLPLCPEVLGRLGVPRPEARLVGGAAVASDGQPLTEALDAGARLADLFATEAGAVRALLVDGSASCGVSVVPGEEGRPTDGQGRLTARLLRRGLPVEPL